MGIYLNPGNDGFLESVRSRIYVDKTGWAAYTNELINTEEKYVCVSRPRRFGKSMALKMLTAYYSRGCDSKELFKGKILENADSFADHLNKYDVIFLNIQQFLIGSKKQDMTEYLEQEVLEELLEEY
ncbi:MAG: AAA family ATPase, partial [Lachnospiraceae bacterium]|nr:AAA family ATPase [Lachnospiraceae bacterium]